MAETNINAYKQELVTALADLDRAQTRVDLLQEYIEAAEPTKKSKAKKQVAKEEIKATDEGNRQRPVVEASTTKVPSKSKGKSKDSQKGTK